MAKTPPTPNNDIANSAAPQDTVTSPKPDRNTKKILPSSSKSYDTKSTKPYRDIMRVTGMTEIVNSGISSVSFAAQIPIKFSQFLVLGFGLFSQNLKPHEQTIQTTQLLLTGAQTILMIGLFLAGKEILVAGALVTRILTLCDMLNKGILLIGWAPSELSKEDTSETPATPAATSTPA